MGKVPIKANIAFQPPEESYIYQCGHEVFLFLQGGPDQHQLTEQKAVTQRLVCRWQHFFSNIDKNEPMAMKKWTWGTAATIQLSVECDYGWWLQSAGSGLWELAFKQLRYCTFLVNESNFLHNQWYHQPKMEGRKGATCKCRWKVRLFSELLKEWDIQLCAPK